MLVCPENIFSIPTPLRKVPYILNRMRDSTRTGNNRQTLKRNCGLLKASVQK